MRRGQSQPGEDLTYIGGSSRAAEDKYVGHNLFGRVVDQNWDKSGTAVDHGATTPMFANNGNMTTDETGRQLVYDAWNRLRVVKNSGRSPGAFYMPGIHFRESVGSASDFS